MKKKILLTTLNARYHHTSLGLRYLLANLDEEVATGEILELNINEAPATLVENLLKKEFDYLAFSVSIWNGEETEKVLRLIRKLCPEKKIILGGPEFFGQIENHPLFPYADFIIEGEGEFILNEILKLPSHKEAPKIWKAELLNLSEIKLPYDLYTDEDIQNRYIYVETTRGCPYRCAFCLSSLAPQVRYFPLDKILASFEKLIHRGAKQFKFIDRTFNINTDRCLEIMNFFHSKKDIFLHFEVVPEILTDKFIEMISRFEEGRLQLEMGIQTLTPHVAKKIDRYLDIDKLKINIQKVLSQTHAHIHADLIVGLPGENFSEIRVGFDQLYSLNTHEIQLGILKLLRGVPLNQIAPQNQCVFSPLSPFEILRNDQLDFETLQRFKRMAKYIDHINNKGRFPTLKNHIKTLPSPFDFFWNFSIFAYEHHPQTHAISLQNLGQLIRDFLLTQNLSEEMVNELLLDICTAFKYGKPKEQKGQHNKRQVKHENKTSH